MVGGMLGHTYTICWIFITYVKDAYISMCYNNT